MLELQRKLLGDRIRNAAFHAALKQAIVPGKSVVLDAGSGTGFLSFLAEKLGAKECVLVESGEVAGLAEALAEHNHIKRCTFVHGHSAEVALPQADIVVSETLGNYALEEGIIDTMNGAREVLTEGGVLIPSALRQFVCPVVSPRLQEAIDVWNVGYDLDFEPARRISLQNMYVKAVQKQDLLDMGKAASAWDTIDFAKHNDNIREATIDWTMPKKETIYGFTLWWEATLAPNIFLSTSPLEQPTHWEQIYLPLLRPIRCAKGETIKLRLHSDTTPETKIRLQWSVEQPETASQTLDTNEGLFAFLALAVVTALSVVTLSACTTPAPVMPPHEHGMTMPNTASGTYVPGSDLQLETLPTASGSQVVFVRDGDVIRLDPTMVRRSIAHGTEVLQYAYNGQIPGPTIVVPQGATFMVDVTNRIDQPTTIHWHGIRLDYRFDGVPTTQQPAIAPDGSFRYTVHVPDAGAYWYHPHVREDIQQDLGLYGMIIVTPQGEPATTVPPITLALDDVLLDEEGRLQPYGKGAEIFSMMGRFGNTQLVNGTVSPTVPVNDVTARVALVNAANTRTFRLSLDGASMRLVGGDVGFAAPKDVQELILGPAERAIIDVTFPAAGSYALLHRGGSQTTALATFQVQHSDAAAPTENAAETVPDLQPHLVRAPDKTLRIAFDGTMTHGMTKDPTGIEWEDTMAHMNAMTNHDNTHWKLIDDDTGTVNMDIHWRFRKGDLVKIRIKNDFESMQHPIHFHGQRFLILASNNVPVTDRQWKDTYLLKTGERVDILLDTSNPGTWMFHCHIAEHLQNGMMGEFIVE